MEEHFYSPMRVEYVFIDMFGEDWSRSRRSTPTFCLSCFMVILSL